MTGEPKGEVSGVGVGLDVGVGGGVAVGVCVGVEGGVAVGVAVVVGGGVGVEVGVGDVGVGRAAAISDGPGPDSGMVMSLASNTAPPRSSVVVSFSV